MMHTRHGHIGIMAAQALAASMAPVTGLREEPQQTSTAVSAPALNDRSKYMPHIGAKQRAKGARRIAAQDEVA